jgi:predicted GNAT family acetyltransferase
VSLHEGDEVIGAVVSAAPRGLVLGALHDDLVPPLVDALVDLVPGVERAEGTSTAAPIFANLYAERLGKTFHPARSDRLHRLVTFVEQKAAGTPRLATLADLDLVRSLMAGYRAEIGDGPGHAESEAWSRVQIERDRLWLWEDGSRPVCLVGRQATVFGATRIGPVYTPPDSRGHGYASALTAHVTQQILTDGSAACLFTDPTNPTSNKIYAAIGYRPVADFDTFTFTA